MDIERNKIRHIFQKLDLIESGELQHLIENYEFDYVYHLQAQAGVRYSLENPQSYIQSNIVGIVNLLESLKKKKIQGLFLSSSSSVYGRNNKMPYKEIYNTDEPKSLYAATKKSGEVISNYYSFYFNMPIVCLRFFIFDAVACASIDTGADAFTDSLFLIF